MEIFSQLVETLARLPGAGRRSAERMALRLAHPARRAYLRELIAVLQAAESRLRSCARCGGVTDAEEDPCRLCTDARREDAILCVVEDAADILTLERAGAFRGRYHALQGKLSPQRGEGPAQLRLAALTQRVAAGGVREVLLALNADVESDATAAFIREALRPTGVRVSRLAFGLPVGGGLAYADALTLSRAVAGRQEL